MLGPASTERNIRFVAFSSLQTLVPTCLMPWFFARNFTFHNAWPWFLDKSGHVLQPPKCVKKISCCTFFPLGERECSPNKLALWCTHPWGTCAFIYPTTQLYNNQHCNLQKYQLSNLTNGEVTAMIVIGHDKKRLWNTLKPPPQRGNDERRIGHEKNTLWLFCL